MECTQDTDGVSVQDLEEAQYHWALSDMAGFLVKYGYRKVIQDLLDYVYLKEANEAQHD
jgi:hypothetical protein